MISYYYNDNQLLDYKTIICSFINYTCSLRDDLDVYFASTLKYVQSYGRPVVGFEYDPYSIPSSLCSFSLMLSGISIKYSSLGLTGPEVEATNFCTRVENTECSICSVLLYKKRLYPMSHRKPFILLDVSIVVSTRLMLLEKYVNAGLLENETG